MGCPACGPAAGAEWGCKRPSDRNRREEAWRRFRETLSQGRLTPATAAAALVWLASVVFDLPS
jgi:hypothetical protein